MHPLQPIRLRKRLTSPEDRPSSPERGGGELDIARLATLAYSSEDPDHPLEHLIDSQRGPRGTRWASARADLTGRIVLEFDRPQRIACVIYEVEECRLERTQEIRVEASSDHGGTYRQVLVQAFNFSPHGATFQHEELQLDLPATTHLRLTIVPNKAGSGTATLTSLRLFGDS